MVFLTANRRVSKNTSCFLEGSADKKLLVSSEALVIPIRTGRAVAGTPPEIRTSLLASVKSVMSMRVPMRRSVSPGSMTRTLRII